MHYFAAIGIGTVISLMLSANGLLQAGVGAINAMLIVHAVGLTAVGLILLVRRQGFRPAADTPWFFYCAGFLGIGLLFINNRTFASLGVTLTVALGLFGQLLASSLIDHFGWFGLERRPFRRHKIGGSLLVVAGVALMALPGWTGVSPDILLGILAGVLVMLSMTINSGLSRRIGVFQSAAVNYTAGLSGVGLLVLGSGSWRDFGLGGVPWYALSGGVLGVVVVSASNVVIPRIPVVYTTILLFLGQLAAGVVLDALLGRRPDARQLGGAALVLGGLLVNLSLDRWAARTAMPRAASSADEAVCRPLSGSQGSAENP